MKFFERFNERKWVNKIKEKHLIIERNYKFNKKSANKISYSEMKKNVSDSDFRKLADRPAWFDFFENDKIIFFEVPWGEVYCECSDSEYKELAGYIDKKFIDENISKERKNNGDGFI